MLSARGKLLVLAILGVLFAAGTVRAEQMPAPVIAIIDFQRVTRDSAAGKNVRAQIDKQYAAYQAEIKKVQDELEKARAELAEQQSILPPEMMKEKREQFQKRAEELQRVVQLRKHQLDEMFSQGMRQVEQALVAILKEIAKERGINMIINASRGQGVVLFADNSLVITDVAREKLDKRLPAVPLKVPETTK